MPVLQLTVKMRQHGQELRNILYYENTLGGVAEANDLADEVASIYDEIMAPSLVDNWELYEVSWRNVSAPGTPSFGRSQTGISGSVTAIPAPLQVAAVVSFKANATRPNRARNYIAGISTGVLEDDGTFNAAMMTILENWGAATLNVSTAIGEATTWERVAVQLADNGTVVGTNPVTTVTASEVPGTQRRRRLGVGN